MRAAHVLAPGRVEVVEAPAPIPAPGYALVRPELVSICGSDLHAVYRHPPKAYPQPVGWSGHEIVGTVEALVPAADGPQANGPQANGPQADGVRPGDRVLALTSVQCGMAERLTTRIEQLLPLPADWPAEELVLAQQLGTVVLGCGQVGNVVGRTVVVIGLGSAGLLFVAMLRRMGADRILALDLSDARVAAGLALGASATFNNSTGGALEWVTELTGGAMADLVVEAVGHADTLNLAPRLVRHGGRILVFGIPPRGPLPFDFLTLFRARCECRSSWGAHLEPGARSTRSALKLILSGAIDVSALTTHVKPLSEVASAYELAHTRGDGALKVAVRL